MDIMQQLSLIGIVPVIAINDAADAVPLAQALMEGGLPCAEVTFRTAAAADAIKNMTEAFPDMIVGAGTVLTCEQVDRAVAAGAKFIVSPGLNPTTVKHCQEIGIPVCPGTANPSDIEVALSLGLKTVKFFPAEAAGGLKYIKSIAAPYVDMKFMPTGGINEKNLLDYLSFNKIICCGGSWMVPGDAVKAKDWDRIRTLTSSAVQLMLGLEIAHVGINSADEAEATDTATDEGRQQLHLRRHGHRSHEDSVPRHEGSHRHQDQLHRARQGLPRASGLRVRSGEREREGRSAQGDLPQGRNRGLRYPPRAEVIHA